MNVLFLCTGNINRSPAAEAIAQHLRPSHFACSRGLSPNIHEGLRISRNMRAALSDKGIPYDPDHRSHGVTEADLEYADIIPVMQASHVRQIMERWPAHAWKLRTLWTWAGTDLTRIPDPNYDSSGVMHHEVVEVLLKAVPAVIDWVARMNP